MNIQALIALCLVLAALNGCERKTPDPDPEYATSAYCGHSVVKPDDAKWIEEWGKAHEIDCRGVN